MPTIASQLTELVNQKKQLAANLTTKGVAATENEKLNTLVPKVLEITSGTGIDTSDATATADDLLDGKTAYVNGEKIEGTILSQAEQTIVPSTIDKTISSGIYIAGTQTIQGDSNLTSDNIKSGTTIFNVKGTFTSDGTATATDILEGKIAYVNGEKITGIYTSGTSAETFTPSNPYVPTTEDIVISTADKLVDSDITISGDSNLLASNIKEGVSIFGITGTYNSGSTSLVEGTLLDTSSFTSMQNTYDSYGTSCYIYEESTGNLDTFADTVDLYGGVPTTENNNNYIGISSYKYGIYMGNWTVQTSAANGLLFFTPLDLISGRLLLNFTCNISTWLNQTINIHLITATGDTQEEILSTIKTKIEAEDYAMTDTLTYTGTANQTEVIYINKSVSGGTYYLYLDGTKTATQSAFSYIKLDYLNI